MDYYYNMKKNKIKKLFLFLCFISLSFHLYARGAEDNSANLTIYGLKGSPGVGMIRLFEDPPKIPGFNVKMEALAQADLMAARFISGEVKLGILPPNLAAKIFSSGRDIKAAAVIGNGMVSLISSDPAVRSLEDLRGKSVEVAGQGATPDYVFQRILRHHGLVPGVDVGLNYSLAPPEIAQSLIVGRVSIALLPEPFSTMAYLGKPDLKSIADIQQEWAASIGTGNTPGNYPGYYPMTLLVVDGSFASENPGAVNEIMTRVKNSIEWVTSHPIEAGALVEKHELGLKAAVAAAAIPKSNYVFIPAIEARPSLEALFNLFLENSPASIGGTLPGDKFYLK